MTRKLSFILGCYFLLLGSWASAQTPPKKTASGVQNAIQNFFQPGSGAKPKRLEPLKLNAQTAAAEALTLYDTNEDGILSGEELDASPALKASLSWLDKNNDRGISADEIAARIKAWQDSKIGLTSPSIRVLYGGRPVKSGTVILTPEPFLGPTFSPATGTIVNGAAPVSCDPAKNPEGLSGLPIGFYTVTFEDVENAPEKMGIEIFDQNPEYRKASSYILELKEKAKP